VDKSLRWLRPVYFAAFAALCMYIGAALWGKAGSTAVYAEAVLKTVSESTALKCIALREEEPVSSSALYFDSCTKLSASENTYSNRSALYCCTCDGLEYLTPESAFSLSEEELFSAEGEKNDGCGKLIYGSDWYIFAVFRGELPLSEAADILIDGEEKPLRARVVYADSGRIILRLTEGLEAHAGLRHFSAQLVTESVSGIGFPSAALREEGGVAFVYAVDAGVVSKKRVDIIYASDDICISAVSRKTDALCEGNTVIVSGENIYEGRVL